MSGLDQIVDHQIPADHRETTQPPYAMADWQAAELAMRTIVRNATLCNQGKDGPDVSILQQGLHILPKSLGEQYGSMHRHTLVDAINARKPKETWVQGAMRRLFGAKADHPALRDNLQWLQQFGDRTSPTMMATMADIQMHLGDMDGARASYQEAMRLVREQGITFTE